MSGGGSGRSTRRLAARQAWAEGTGKLPRALSELRREFFLRVQHGDTPGVLHMLNAGVDHGITDEDGRTLPDLIHLLDRSGAAAACVDRFLSGER